MTLDNFIKLLKYESLISDSPYVRTAKVYKKSLHLRRNDKRVDNIKINFDDIPKDVLQEHNLVVLKDGVSLRKATPSEFHEKLLELSNLLNEKYIHKDWMKLYSYICEFDFVINNDEQNNYLSKNNIAVGSNWFKVGEDMSEKKVS